MAAAIIGCDPIIVLEPHEARRALALELGAHRVLDPGDTPVLPTGMDHVLDTTGRPALLEQGLVSLGRRGTLGLVAASPQGTRLAIGPNDLVSHGQRIIGIIEGDSNPQIFIPQLIAHYRAGRLPFDRMIRRYPLSDINTAIDDQHAGRVVKAVLIP